MKALLLHASVDTSVKHIYREIPKERSPEEQIISEGKAELKKDIETIKKDLEKKAFESYQKYLNFEKNHEGKDLASEVFKQRAVLKTTANKNIKKLIECGGDLTRILDLYTQRQDTFKGDGIDEKFVLWLLNQAGLDKDTFSKEMSELERLLALDKIKKATGHDEELDNYVHTKLAFRSRFPDQPKQTETEK